MDPLLLLIIVLVLVWGTGAFLIPVGGSLIHLLLVIVLVILVYRLLQGQRIV